MPTPALIAWSGGKDSAMVLWRLSPEYQPIALLTNVQRSHDRVSVHGVRSSGSIQIDKHVYYLGHKLAGQGVLLHLDAQQQCWHVSLNGKRLPRSLPLKGLHDGPLELQTYLTVLCQEAVSIAHHRERLWLQSGSAA